MAGRLVLHGPVLSGGRELPPSRVEIAHGRIVAVDAHGAAADAELRLDDGYIAPGFVDLQVNGAGGVDLTSAAEPDEAVAAVARILAQHGVTSFCPTIVSSAEPVILERLDALRPRVLPEGAESLGAHVEGPFISREHPGVHDPAVQRDPTLAEVDRWLTIGRPRIVTLAPELPGALEAIRALRAAGVVVSIGHTGADAEATARGLKAGASMGTHLFNAMPPFHHRRPGTVGALLASDGAIGLIVDGVHVDRVAVQVAVRAAGHERIAVVSDAIAAAGAPPGPIRLGDQTVHSDGRTVRRADGTLSGSAVLLDAALRDARSWFSWLSDAEVVEMATGVPARALGPDVAARKGRIVPGLDADLVVLGTDLSLRATVLRGEIVGARVAA